MTSLLAIADPRDAYSHVLRGFRDQQEEDLNSQPVGPGAKCFY